jgi:D-alanine-D-alanine ligase
MLDNRPTVLVLMGGPDAEREVSLVSGRAVAEALRATDRFRVVEHVIDAITAEELERIILRERVRIVFPALHGSWGEGGPMQQVLEDCGVAYVGSKPRPAALAMNKVATKQMLAPDCIQTPESQIIASDDDCTIDPPLVLKPVDDGSSVDLRICRSTKAVGQARAELHPRRSRLLAERYIDGRELTVGILAGEALPLIEIIPADAVEFYDYEAKYERDDTRYIVDPDVPRAVAEQCRDVALLAFRRLGCRDIARVDFMYDARGPWFLEINTMPGFTPHSLVPMAARAIGLEMPDICRRLVETALVRGPSYVAATARR